MMLPPGLPSGLPPVLAEVPTDSTTALLTYGPLGVFAVLAIVAFRVIWKRFNELLTAATERAEAAEAKNDALVAKVVDQVVPALTRSTDASAQVLAELRRDRDRR